MGREGLNSNENNTISSLINSKEMKNFKADLKDINININVNANNNTSCKETNINTEFQNNDLLNDFKEKETNISSNEKNNIKHGLNSKQYQDKLEKEKNNIENINRILKNFSER